MVKRKHIHFSRKMTAVLQLQPRHAFNAFDWDISIVFIFIEKSRKTLNIILKFMYRKRVMLISYIFGVKLLIFTSNQFGMDSKLIWS